MKLASPYSDANSLSCKEGPVEALRLLRAGVICLTMTLAVSQASSQEVLSDLNSAEAESLVAERKWTDALPLLQALRKEQPWNRRVQYSLVEALLYLNRREESLGILKGIIDAESSPKQEKSIERYHIISRTFLSRKTQKIFLDGLELLEARKYSKAADLFYSALRKEPSNIEILIRLSQSLFASNQIEAAIEHLLIAKKLNPYESEISLWLGRGFFLQKLFEKSAAELALAYKLDPESELAPAWYAEALASVGNAEGGIRILESDLQKHPLHLLSLIMLSRLRLAGPTQDLKALWNSKRSLQLAISRFERYSSVEHAVSNDLSFRFYPTERVKNEILTSLRDLDRKIELSQQS